MNAVLGAFTILPVETGTVRHDATIRATLERRGTPTAPSPRPSIGANDMLIAAHARAVGAVCVTDDVAEFERVPGLEVEHWIG